MPTSQTSAIRLITEVPGPKSRELHERRMAAVPGGLGNATQIGVARANGAIIEDVDGNHLLDFVGGIGVLATGHTPPAIVEAVQQQAAELLHLSALVGSYEPYIALAERLNALVPISGPKKTLFANSGAESVENAVKIARAATSRPAIIAFEGGYHGRTLGTLSLTSKYGLFKKQFGPFLPEIYRAPFPYVYRLGGDEERAVESTWQAFERVLIAHVDPSDVAAIVIEPVQGEGGFLPVPAEFMRRLRAVCDRHGIVLIADEVQCGFGRTGTLFAIEQTGVEPDLLVSAKSLAAGLPLSAVTGRAELMDAPHLGGVGGTYGGNPLACVAALEVLKQIERERLCERAVAIGGIIRERAAPWQREIELVGDVRGLGAMLAIELVRDRRTLEPAFEETLAVVKRCVARGLLVMRAGLYSNCIRLLTPLVITDEQLHEGLDVLGAALAEVGQQMTAG
jgi:4-aminobutyrate aminotransferase / (S)-3-amino-2-methylpropionate transaminase / 5-aminovalerate transaminase